MMFQRMFNIIKHGFTLPFFLFFICLLVSSRAIAGDESYDCPLDNTPLAKCSSYSGYIDLDKKLNFAYRKLYKSLRKNDQFLLKSAQREWIKWRDEKCDDIQEKSGCDTGSCDGNAHDLCILQLTEKRTTELRQFIKNAGEAEKQKFEFSRKYESLYDHD